MIAPLPRHAGLTAAQTGDLVAGGGQRTNGVAAAAFAAERVVGTERSGAVSATVTLQAFDVVLAQALTRARVASVSGIEGPCSVAVTRATTVRVGVVEVSKPWPANVALEPDHIGLAETLSDDLTSCALVLDAVALVGNAVGIAHAWLTGGGVRGETPTRTEETKLASLAVDTSCIILAVQANPAPSHFIAVREGINGGVVPTGGGVAVAATRLARETVAGCAIPPRLVAVSGETRLAVSSLCVVLTLAQSIQLRATATGMTVAGTPCCHSYFLYGVILVLDRSVAGEEIHKSQSQVRS